MTVPGRHTTTVAALLVSVVCLASCSVRPPAAPETVPEPPPSEPNEEIVVTATRTVRPAPPAPAAMVAEEFFEQEAIETAADEIWVIAKATRAQESVRTRSERASTVRREPADPGTGTTLVRRPADAPDAVQLVPLPLEHTAVDAAVAGYIGTVQVRQRFGNPFDTKIEAVYVFPLPEKAAVSEFLMVIGDRTIRGILREKEEAEAIYRHARERGYRASLLVQRRPNIFEQKVANIEPGAAIDVDITYFHTLAYNDGWYSFVFPTVVGPRYNPVGHTDPSPRCREAAGRRSRKPPASSTSRRPNGPATISASPCASTRACPSRS